MYSLAPHLLHAITTLIDIEISAPILKPQGWGFPLIYCLIGQVLPWYWHIILSIQQCSSGISWRKLLLIKGHNIQRQAIVIVNLIDLLYIVIFIITFRFIYFSIFALITNQLFCFMILGSRILPKMKN